MTSTMIIGVCAQSTASASTRDRLRAGGAVDIGTSNGACFVLTLNLRKLERDGLLVRTVYPTVPPRVEYQLTDMARELYASLRGLLDWAERHRGSIALARAAYDQGRVA